MSPLDHLNQFLANGTLAKRLLFDAALCDFEQIINHPGLWAAETSMIQLTHAVHHIIRLRRAWLAEKEDPSDELWLRWKAVMTKYQADLERNVYDKAG